MSFTREEVEKIRDAALLRSDRQGEPYDWTKDVAAEAAALALEKEANGLRAKWGMVAVTNVVAEDLRERAQAYTEGRT